MIPDSDFLNVLSDRYGLKPETVEQFQALAEHCVSLEISGTAIRTAEEAMRLHVADSLAGLEIPAIADARTLIDIGTGVGFPGIVLAAARPDLKVTLLDGVRKKVEAATEISRKLGLRNIEAIWARVEDFSAVGSPARESFDVVTARALAATPVLLEYAAPLLRVGGSLVAWKGRPEEVEMRAARTAQHELGYDDGALVEARPFAESQRRHFYVAKKTAQTDKRFPRRPGAALRKPL
ncbi:MAG: 16S rRNA (guanine(527)-N(7))-methyltransferase RsmG [Actinobacteria bacterium]|nr:16S rRNA (guanine(527)-N(7))-methyltransferase RsmG [Actinomycetota bacterium]